VSALRDFSLEVYANLLQDVGKTGWKVFTLKDYFERRQDLPAFIVLRHDVDRRPHRALDMASVENALGVRSTYYFRMNRRVLNKDIIRSVAAMGHEIGYHYEVLDKARGDVAKAERIFQREVAELRRLADVSTAAMHGNPLSRWDNRDFWDHFAPSHFGLAGEAYVSMGEADLVYLTDTGRGWNRMSFNLRDRFPFGGAGSMPALSRTSDLIRFLREKRHPKIYLQVHPNRWTSGSLAWHGQWAEDLLLNAVKRLLIPIRRGTGRS